MFQIPGCSSRGMPTWFHPQGMKMLVKEFLPRDHYLLIMSRAAKLKIVKCEARLPDSWIVDWEIVQNQHENSSGRIIMPTGVLRAAFALEAADTDLSSQWLIRRYGGDFADQGRCIRWGNFLNIPHPGTGHDGDLNLSLYVTRDMQEDVRQLTAS